MHITDVEFHQAASLDEALDLKQRFGAEAHVLAGGTDLLVELATGRTTTKHVISLSALDGLKQMAVLDDGSLAIGSLVTIAQLCNSPLISGKFTPIRETTIQMATPQIRNMATIGGNIAGAVPCADTPPILICMGATVGIQSADGHRTVPLREMFAGPRQTALKPNEIITSVTVPAQPDNSAAAYERFALRDGNAIPVAGVAGSITVGDAKQITQACITLASVAPIPRVVDDAGQDLVGKTIDEAVVDHIAEMCSNNAQPICDVRGSDDYRRRLVTVLTRRCLYRLRDMIGN
ncbi:MAG: xanthine dehydrogenase family protein subunit M [Planctomycetes bacterium]|nr:xanthine dehydrogenase family protein subunit M [Planctomycetota bacterium]NOG53713.1 xanthine dehydrogenase family protein subunit M [Planctomycetota bacterium]